MSATSTSPQPKVGASVRGGVVGPGGIIDVDAATYALRRKVVRIPLPSIVQNATTKHSLGAYGIGGNIVAAYISYRTLPTVASGTATFKLVKYDGSTETDLTAATNLLSGLTARVGNSIAITSESAGVAADVVEWHVTVSNNAPTQGTEGFLVLVIDPTEATSISQ